MLPLLLAVLLVLKRDLDHKVLLDFSAPVLRQTVAASYGAAAFQGKVVVVTGANSGVGLGVAQAMASLGATVVMACRSQARCDKAAETIVGSAVPVASLQLDLSSFASVHAFSDAFLQKYDRLDVLFANAGFAMPPSNGATTTEEGFELGFGTMHLGHFLLFERLRDTIAKTAATSGGGAGNTRVVMTSSAASQFSVMGADFHDSIFDEEPGDLRGELTSVNNKQYGRSKLANVLFARHLQKIMPEITTCSCHVGAVATSIWNLSPGSPFQRLVDGYTRFVMRNLEGGRRTVLKCALSQDDDVVQKGAYLDGMGLVTSEARLHPPSRNDSLAARLWEVSEMLIKGH